MMDEKEFKKLASNSRDWLIYQLLSERSKEVVLSGLQDVSTAEDYPVVESIIFQPKEIKSEHVSGVNTEISGEKEMVKKGIGDDSLVDKPEPIRLFSNERVFDAKEGIPSIHSKPPNPKGETTVREIIEGIVRIVTELAVQIVVGIRSTWIPKSAIKNLSSVVLEQGKPVSVDLHSWFVPKVEWKVI